MSVTIMLSRGYVTIIDEADEDLVRLIGWRAQGRAPNIYAAIKIGGRRSPRVLYLHRALLAAPKGLEVDHINGDKLDNRRSNLRLATRKENGRNQKLNARNKTGIAGVTIDKNGRFWARLKFEGRQLELGRHCRIEDAAAARAAAEVKYFGEFRRTTTPS